MPKTTDTQEARRERRMLELAYHMLECSFSPDHPTTRMNRARWERELRQLKAEDKRA